MLFSGFPTVLARHAGKKNIIFSRIDLALYQNTDSSMLCLSKLMRYVVKVQNGQQVFDHCVAPNLESNPNKAAYHITAVVRALSSMPVTQLTVNR